MATYELDTRLSPDDVLDRADTFFGESGLVRMPSATHPL
jgi:hypothetical protein